MATLDFQTASEATILLFKPVTQRIKTNSASTANRKPSPINFNFIFKKSLGDGFSVVGVMTSVNVKPFGRDA